MRTNNKKMCIRVFSLMIFLIMTSNVIQAQKFNLVNNESSLKVFGTSNIHDWHIDAEEQSGTLTFKNVATGAIEKCNIAVVVESLKSGKSSMDKNTYKALNADSYTTISFQLTEVKKVTSKGDGKFDISSQGDLTISGVKKSVPLDFTVVIAGDKTILTGEKKIVMTEYNIEPPKALFGTITTGDEVTIKFSTQFK